MGNKRLIKLSCVWLAACLLAAGLLPGMLPAGVPALAQATFNDIADQPVEIQQAIEYVHQKGYMQGFGDGSFHPNEATTRLDCARGMVSVFGHAGESPDPSITFTDMAQSDPGYVWANLAVKYGYVDRCPDGSFAPSQAVVFERLVLGTSTGLGLTDTEKNINEMISGAPYYGGAMAIFMDLHLKYRYSGVWPGCAYPRGEMAYTLYKMDNLDSWRISYLEESFTPERCDLPAAADDQIRAVRFGFERLGCPYVYGGERESEGGFDCSGFVYNTLSIRMGYPMMRVADDQARDDRYLFVSREALQPGDAIFFYGEENANPSCYINHAGMYVGNGVFIHSTGSNAGVSFDCLDNSSYWGTHLAWGRRVVGGPYYDRFDTFLLLCNPSQRDIPVEVRFLRKADGPETSEYVLAPHSRYTIPVDLLYPWDEVSVEVKAPSPGVVAERAMYFDYQDWADGGHASVGTGEAYAEGFFAEGYTGPGFHTWLLLANPGDETAEVEVSYLLEGDEPVVRTYSVAPSSRYTVFLNEVEGLDPGNMGIKYRSLNGAKVAAERAVYFDYMGRIRGGHCSQAIDSSSTELYLSEGYTGGDFDTWILLANPGTEEAEVRITFLLQGGGTVVEGRTIPPLSRLTVNAAEVVGDQSFGVEITSLNGVGVVAERAMYFAYDGDRRGGHCSAAVDGPSTRSFLAEGYTGGAFDTWILLANPNEAATSVSVSFYREDGTVIPYQANLPGKSRFTLKANEVGGLEGCSFSLQVESDLPILAERSMYFFYKDRSGGSNCPALDAPDLYRYFAEGYTGG